MATAIAEKRKTLDQFLVDEGYITKKDLSSAQMEQAKGGIPLDNALINLKILDEEKLTRAKAVFFHLPYIDLRNVNITKEPLEIVSKETIENYRFLPFAKRDKDIRVALTNPSDLQALEALEFLAQKGNYLIELYLSSKTSFDEALRRTRNISTEVTEALKVMEEKEKDEKHPEEEAKVPEKQKLGQEAPITKIVDVILTHAIQAHASDVHIEPQENELRIRYRIDGILHSSLIVPKVVHPAIVSRIKILSNLKIDEQRLPQDGRFHMDIDKRSIDFRVSTLPTVTGEKVVMRILDKSGGVPTFDDLGLVGMKLDRIMENIKKTHGMLLITGPTGSGKSTTLYAALSILNKIGVNIVTLEDPVEYFIDGVNQAQVNPEIGLTFASGLRSILRQDPNIIMVGEIRDRETAELGVHSALTGHLVFSTLHTNDAIGAIPRLLDMGIEPFLVTASVNLVMAQRLVRKICHECRHPIEVPDEVKKMLREELGNIPKEETKKIDLNDIKMFKGKGCKACSDTGYESRIGIFEVMPMTETLKNIVLEKGSIASLLKQAVSEGMISMKQDGYIKVLQGLTTLEEVIRVTKE